MKNVSIEDTTHLMLVEMSKKQNLSPRSFMDSLLSGLYMEMKRTGKPPLK